VVDEDSENQRLGMLVEKGECVCKGFLFIIFNFFVKMIFTTKIKNNGGGFLVGWRLVMMDIIRIIIFRFLKKNSQIFFS